MLICTDIRPGDIGRVVEMHGELYAREYGLDRTFEGYVAAGLGEFAVGFDGSRDRLWLAEAEGGRLVGSIAIAGRDGVTAQLRWFLVRPEMRGSGLGGRLLGEAVEFCRGRGFRSVFLWTISELAAAAHLYRRAGFTPTERTTHDIWGAPHTEERYDLALRSPEEA
jgi:GNAT superfamily N-acetyltransferase